MARSDLLSKDALFFSFSRNIELKTSKYEFTNRSHQNKQGKKKPSRADFTAFQQNVCKTMAYTANLKQRLLLFSYLNFRIYFACYPPESFENNLVDLHLVEIRRYKLSFFAKPATKSFLTGPPLLPNLKKVVTRMDTSIRLDTVCLLHNAILYLVEFIGHENF